MTLINQPRFSLLNATPVCGFERERDGSFGIGANIGDKRFGIFFEPAKCACNPSNAVRIKVWDTAIDSMVYASVREIDGVGRFARLALEATDASVREQVKQALSEFL